MSDHSSYARFRLRYCSDLGGHSVAAIERGVKKRDKTIFVKMTADDSGRAKMVRWPPLAHNTNGIVQR